MKKIIVLVVVMLLLNLTVFGANQTINNTNGTNNTQQQSIVYKCSDGFDNDGDGLIDYDGHGDVSKKDPGCFGPADDDESGSGSAPVLGNNTNSTNGTESGGGTDVPWALVIGLAVPAIFLVAGLASSKQGAADLAKEKLKGVAGDKLVAVAGPGAPEAIQGLTLLNDPSNPGQLLIAEAKEKAIGEIIKQVPTLGPMLEIKGKLEQLKADGKVLFDDKTSVKLGSDGNVDFENLGFAGEKNVDATNIMLGKGSRDKKDKIELKGFKGDKKDKVTTLTVTDANQELVLERNGEKGAKDKRTFEGMKKDSVIKVDEEGKVVEADITVGDKGGTFDLGEGENKKRYELPPGAKIHYNGSNEEVEITNLGEKGEATVTLPKPDGTFDETKKFTIFKSTGKITVNGNTIKGNEGLILKYGTNTGEILKVEKVGNQGYDLEIDSQGRGVKVKRGIVEKDHLKFNIEKDEEEVLLVNRDADPKKLEGEKSSWVKKDDKSLKAVTGKKSILKFEVLDGDPLFKPDDQKGVLKVEADGEGTEISVSRDSKKNPKAIPKVEVKPSPKGRIEITSGEAKIISTRRVLKPGEISSGETVNSLSANPTKEGIPMEIKGVDSKDTSKIIVTSDGATRVVELTKDSDQYVVDYAEGKAVDISELPPAPLAPSASAPTPGGVPAPEPIPTEGSAESKPADVVPPSGSEAGSASARAFDGLSSEEGAAVGTTREARYDPIETYLKPDGSLTDRAYHFSGFKPSEHAIELKSVDASSFISSDVKFMVVVDNSGGINVQAANGNLDDIRAIERGLLNQETRGWKAHLTEGTIDPKPGVYLVPFTH